jgi:hypothetical protein
MTKLAEEEVNRRMLDDGETREMADQKGTWEKNARSGGSSRQSTARGSEAADLKGREYRDENGQVQRHQQPSPPLCNIYLVA